MLDKTFEAAEVEPRISKIWEEANAFAAGRGKKDNTEPFTIVIPPPNVTGSLHMGHALNNTLQDILIRTMRMRGRDVLWQMGTDHAGIATQMVVERQVESEGKKRRDMGRAAFLERVWTWKEKSGGTIASQLKRLGASCDWSRERFTMDEGLSRAVLKAFVTLYQKGLIYKDKRLVNWDPKLKTAISDLEVEPVEVKGHLWYFRYPIEGEVFLEDNPSSFLCVATTRPETMLGDTAVAVHPDDERYRHLIGRHIRLPLVGRLIPIIGDPYSDPEKGSGAVKITPAHDFNDFEVAQRNKLNKINILDRDAHLFLKDNDAFLADVPSSDLLSRTLEVLHGQERFAARKLVVALMQEGGFIEKIEPHIHTVPHGDRGGVPIEPFLTDQWYVKAADLAGPALAAVQEGRTVFVPKSWEKTYFEWMENIQPWCISRQLWWGHQIPAWYGPDGEIFVAMNEEEAKAQAEAHYGTPVALTRDEDVLDTWFSSALWPFSTLGWPDETPELERYFPTSVLVTGFDIIFFWVARMMMMSLEFMKKEPFQTVYVHALVRDEKGAKMSKSKGNVIDPLDLIEEYGADALRFTLASMAAPGRDIKLAVGRVAGYRNFTTKLWNAVRFALMNGCRHEKDFAPHEVQETLNRWIIAEVARTAAHVTTALDSYRFDEAAAALYRFVWATFCDWFLELAKPILTGPDGPSKNETRASAAYAIDEMLKLLHPFMPFITEELWEKTAGEGKTRTQLLALTSWPELLPVTASDASDEINWLIEVISEIRALRAEMGIAPAIEIPLLLVGASSSAQGWILKHQAAIRRLARIASIDSVDHVPAQAAQIVTTHGVIALPLAGLIDLAAARERLAREMEKLDDEIGRIEAKLGNENFIARAPEEIVEEQRSKREAYAERLAKVKEALARVG